MITTRSGVSPAAGAIGQRPGRLVLRSATAHGVETTSQPSRHVRWRSWFTMLLGWTSALRPMGDDTRSTDTPDRDVWHEVLGRHKATQS